MSVLALFCGIGVWIYCSEGARHHAVRAPTTSSHANLLGGSHFGSALRMVVRVGHAVLHLILGSDFCHSGCSVDYFLGVMEVPRLRARARDGGIERRTCSFYRLMGDAAERFLVGLG
jgi:hypothetical protein